MKAEGLETMTIAVDGDGDAGGRCAMRHWATHVKVAWCAVHFHRCAFLDRGVPIQPVDATVSLSTSAGVR